MSKWERGQGFPDIKLIEPLAEVLGVSILELMRGERIPEEARPADIGPEVAALICMLFLVEEIEGFHPIEFSMMVFPWVCWGICPVLLVICWLRHRKGLSWHLLAFCTFWVFALPILTIIGALLFLTLAWRLGVPAPW